jgi:hypothetical protein
MITEEDLESGLIFRTKDGKGNMHREFSTWKVGALWMRFNPEFGEIAGRKDTMSLLRFLNRYNFRVVGKCELKYFHTNYIAEPFNLDGAL